MEVNLWAVVPVFFTFLGGVIAALLTYLGGRKKGTADAAHVQAQTDATRVGTDRTGFQMVIAELRQFNSELQRERLELVKVIDAQSEEITELKKEIRELRLEVRGYAQDNARLEQSLIRAGLPVPGASNAPSQT